jgi:PRTRC genetic system protein E
MNTLEKKLASYQSNPESSADHVCYSDEALGEFKANIDKKLDVAEKELEYLKSFVQVEDDKTKLAAPGVTDSKNYFEKEQLEQMIVRQQTFIENLNAALTRIENKTYGICRTTGKLIDKARLLAVPHATLSLEAKLGLDKKTQEAASIAAAEHEKKVEKKSKRKEKEKQPETVRYPDDDLRNFKTLISNKIDTANEELKYLKIVLIDRNRGIRVEDYEEMEPAEVEALIDRKKSFINELESALDRVKKKTYGICEETKQLIPKEILLQSPIIKRLCPTPERASSVIENNNTDTERKCRICGCTEDDCSQCIEKTGEPCYWIDSDLCSACEEENMKQSENKTKSAIEDIEPLSTSEEDEHLIIKSGAGQIELSEAEKKHIAELENNLSSNNDNDMNFFQQLAQAGAQNVDITLRIMQKDGKLTVGIMPGIKSATLKPVNMTGTPGELDAEFFKTIMPGVTEIRGIVTNLEKVKKEVEKKKDEPPEKSETSTSVSHKPAAKKPVKKAGAKKDSVKAEKKKVEVKEEKVADPEPNMFG